MKRVLSGVIAIPVVLGIVNYGSYWLFFALVAAAVLIGCYEYFSMISNAGIDGFPILGCVLSFFLLLCFSGNGEYFVIFGPVAVASIFFACLLKEKNVRLTLDQISYTLLGVIYVGGFAGYYLLIHQLPGGRHFIFFLFLIIWLGDTASFVVGRNFGARPLAPGISPNKTVEGAAGGLAGSFIGAVISKVWFLEEMSLAHCLIVALICGIIGQLGDLAESLIKRNAGVKDSGGLIPGHGGILDRIDSLLFAGPAFYCYYKLFL